MCEKGFDSVDEIFRWKMNEIRRASVEEVNKSFTDALNWEHTDVLYSFLLVYKLGLKITDEKRFHDLVKEEKERRGIQRLNSNSTEFLYACSKAEEYQEFNENKLIKEFLKLYFDIGNVIPIWPGGNEARGKMGIYDIPEIFFNKNPYWTKALCERYPNASLDRVIHNDLFLAFDKDARILKGYRDLFCNVRDFETVLMDHKDIYFEYLKRRNNVIAMRSELLQKELQKNN